MMTQPIRLIPCTPSLLFAMMLIGGRPGWGEEPTRLTGVAAVDVGVDPERLKRIDAALAHAVESKQIPGAEALVARRGKVIYHKAVGDRSLVPDREPLSVGTIFDMASLTKPVATATSIMTLIEQGAVRLEGTLREYLPEFDNHGKGGITIEQLLRHRSGLIADNALADYADGPEKAWERLANLGLQHEPGARFVYSDVNYMILGRIVGKVSGRPLDVYARETIFGPLGMTDTGFRPSGSETSRIAPTEPDEGGVMLRGVVHDPRSRALGGVAGHAGLFSTADDLAVYGQMLLDGGVGVNGARVLSPLGVRAMTTGGDTPAGQRRGLGWDIATGFSSPRGALFGESGFGHTGFTGTSLWVDPESEMLVILLTSRLHPDGKGRAPTELRRTIATLAAAAITDMPTEAARVTKFTASTNAARTRDSQVLCGIDVLVLRQFDILKGKRVGLVTNQTGQAVTGSSTIDILAKAGGVTLAALFSPEHGIRGQVDREVDDSRDEATGLIIHSLYGKNRSPTAEQMAELDVLVYDIQDIGTRFYTYISTLGHCLEAAKARGIPLVILDRPNPIGGLRVDGPVRDEGQESFIAYHRLPLVHGMTVGELARMFNGERGIGAELVVVPCEGWERGDLYDSTGLLWVNPSPNMRSLTEALFYPGVGLLEGTNLATGRGTDTPFERVGAPWIDAPRFAAALNRSGIPGVRFLPVRFTPTERQFAGEECGGVYIQLVDRQQFDPVALGLGLAVTLRLEYPDDWKTDKLKGFLTDDATLKAIHESKSVDAIRALWIDELREFRQAREHFLIYP